MAGVWKDAGADQKGEQGAEVQRRVVALAAMQEAIMGRNTGQECGKAQPQLLQLRRSEDTKLQPLSMLPLAHTCNSPSSLHTPVR